MSGTDNEALMRRWFEEVWNQRRTTTIEELMHPDVIGHHEHQVIEGRDAFERYHRESLESVPDMQVTVANVMAVGDAVLVEWVNRGTHEGEALGVPPSHERVEFKGATWLGLEGGRIVEFRTYWTASFELRAQLERAQAEIETLKGILPICSHCKKIRRDDGYWEQLERYVSQRSDAQFSHGICPECYEKHYPEIVDN